MDGDTDSVTVDPITGMITTTSSVKRTSTSSTPPISSSTSPGASNAAALAAAANRERLEQRMRGIFKKPTDSPPSTPPSYSTMIASSSVNVSRVGSPSPSARKSMSTESADEKHVKEKTPENGKDQVKDDVKEEIKEKAPENSRDQFKDDINEEIKEKTPENDLDQVKDDAAKEIKEKSQDEDQDKSRVQDTIAAEPLVKDIPSDDAGKDTVNVEKDKEEETPTTNTHATEPEQVKDAEVTPTETPDGIDEHAADATAAINKDTIDSKTTPKLEDISEAVKDEPSMTDEKEEAFSVTSEEATVSVQEEPSTDSSQEASEESQEQSTVQIETNTKALATSEEESSAVSSDDSENPPDAEEALKANVLDSPKETDDKEALLHVEKEKEEEKTRNKPESQMATTNESVSLVSSPRPAKDGDQQALSDENPLKRVVEQREEQLLKAMQEQSSLIERVRELEESKVADDALLKLRITGLETIVANQKKDLEVARSSQSSAQPKSIQKTLDEQRVLLEEKDEQIKGLLSEGEVLSKKELKNLTTIKTLRMKMIETEKGQIDVQKKLDKVTSDLTDTHSKLTKAQDENKQFSESIKNYLEAAQRQSKQGARMEAEITQLREEKANLQLGLDRAWQELDEARKTSEDLSNQKHAEALEKEKQLTEELQQQVDTLKKESSVVELTLRQEIQELRASLSNREEMAGEKEDQLWMEIKSLQARLEQTDNDSFELQEAMDEARRPLLMQIDVLQKQHLTANRNWEKVEKSLTRRVVDAEEDVAKAQERERIARGKLDEMKSQNTTMEARLETLRTVDTQIRSEMSANKRLLAEQEEAARQAQAELGRERLNRSKALDEAKADMERKWRQSQQVEIERLKQQIQQQQSQLQQLQQQQQQQQQSSQSSKLYQDDSTLGGGSGAGQGSIIGPVPLSAKRPSFSTGPGYMGSPGSVGSPVIVGTSSGGRADRSSNTSVRASFDSTTSPTNMDGLPGALSRTGSSQTISGVLSGNALSGMGGGSSAGTAVAIERLTTITRQLEGQVAFLTEQARSAQKDKDELSEELVRVTMELEDLQKVATKVPGLEQELTLLQDRHRAALEMLGEKTEEVQELRADIVDVKEAYRDQISELLAQLEKARNR
ncbi:hypothetical protein BGW38_010009 [Lunasporangiospora selenospora]|uniref:TATA element modulatory factor 1 TATA binding domain-containing protein n=1 Tax=Lunasporangiospora selenospora TaxID=979761 RepID=A0A9P6FY17_9FUNG|nr:hypothetical protein BGW38_010009 [Lunasporangiospora selenospora]